MFSNGSTAIEGRSGSAGGVSASATRAEAACPASPGAGEMLRGFVRDGAIHLLGGKTLPDGVFVKIVKE